MNPNQNQHGPETNDDGLLSAGRTDPNNRTNADRQVVNEEDQTLPVNPVGGESDGGYETPGEIQIPDGGSEVENPQRVEGDDAESTERKIPNL